MDANFTPDDTTSFFLFYTFAKMDAEQNGREHDSNNADSQTDATRNWQVNHDDNTHTVGLGARSHLMEKRLTLKADYAFTQSVTNITSTAGTNVAVANPVDLPNLGTVRHSFETTGEYKIDETWSWGISYLYENYKEDDFATDSLTPGTALNSGNTNTLIPLSVTDQDYNGHLFTVFASYRIGK